MKYITSKFIEYLEKRKGKINKKAIEYLNKDRALVIEYNNEIFIEPTSFLFSIPNYIYYLFLKFKNYYKFN